MSIIDFHTHAFPDAIARQAIHRLEEEGDIKAVLDGTVGALLASMDRAGIERSVVAGIAVSPKRVSPILEWARSIASERLIPFPSVHPAAVDAPDQVRHIAEEGFKGIKFHPYYQEFTIDEPRMFPIYEAIAATGLLALVHTGYDLAFERVRRADPARILKVVDAFPGLKLITSHLLAWEDWDEARRLLVGKPIYTDLSMSIESMPRAQARELILGHPRDHVLFGTDSPWVDQAAQIDYVRSLELGDGWERSIFHGNAAALLDGAGA